MSVVVILHYDQKRETSNEEKLEMRLFCRTEASPLPNYQILPCFIVSDIWMLIRGIYNPSIVMFSFSQLSLFIVICRQSYGTNPAITSSKITQENHSGCQHFFVSALQQEGSFCMRVANATGNRCRVQTRRCARLGMVERFSNGAKKRKRDKPETAGSWGDVEKAQSVRVNTIN